MATVFGSQSSFVPQAFNASNVFAGGSQGFDESGWAGGLSAAPKGAAATQATGANPLQPNSRWTGIVDPITGKQLQDKVSPNPQQQTGWTGMSPTDVMPWAQSWIANQGQRAAMGLPTLGTAQQYYPGQSYANFDPYELLAQQQLVGQAAPAQQAIANQAGQGYAGVMGSMDVRNNPALAAAAEGAIRPVTQQLNEQILPNIRGSAIQAGGYGGSRQQVMEAQAVRDATQAMIDRTAGMYSSAYGQGLDATARGLALAPGLQQTYAQPATTIGQVGAQQREMQQVAIDDAMARWDFQQNEPWMRLGNYANLLGGSYQSPAQASTQGPSRLSKAMGGAATGAAVGSAVPVIGSTVGAVGGALLGYFS